MLREDSLFYSLAGTGNDAFAESLETEDVGEDDEDSTAMSRDTGDDLSGNVVVEVRIATGAEVVPSTFAAAAA